MIYFAAILLLLGWLISEYWFSIMLIVLPFFIVPAAIGASLSIASDSDSGFETILAVTFNILIAGASVYGFLWAIGAL